LHLRNDETETSFILIKEVVQHLPLRDGIRMLRNIKSSGIRYLMITNHDKDLFDVHENTDVETGGFYPNNMFMTPFCFSDPIEDIANVLPRQSQAGHSNLMVFDMQNQSI